MQLYDFLLYILKPLLLYWSLWDIQVLNGGGNALRQGPPHHPPWKLLKAYQEPYQEPRNPIASKQETKIITGKSSSQQQPKHQDPNQETTCQR